MWKYWSYIEIIKGNNFEFNSDTKLKSSKNNHNFMERMGDNHSGPELKKKKKGIFP